jgi:MOSC domain-containing protein YiiM
MAAVERVELDRHAGVVGDRWLGRPGSAGTRQVTLITEEALLAIARFLGLASVPPEALRRNVVVGGINLLALRDKRVVVGSAVLDITGECHPCSRMEEILGAGGYNAVRGQGGVTAKIVEPGVVCLGDAISLVSSTCSLLSLPRAGEDRGEGASARPNLGIPR